MNLLLSFNHRFFCILFLPCLLYLSCLSNPKSDPHKQFFLPKTTIEKIAKSFRGEQNKPATYQTLYLHVIKNRSNQSLLSSRLKQKLTFSFNSGGHLQVISNKKKAHVWFYGKITNYQKIPLRLDQFNRVTTFRLGILVEVKITLNSALQEANQTPNSDIKRQEILLIKKEVRFDTNHSPLEPPFETEILAHERLLDGLTDRVVYASIEGWYSQLKRVDELNQKQNSNLLKTKKN